LLIISFHKNFVKFFLNMLFKKFVFFNIIFGDKRSKIANIIHIHTLLVM